MPGFASSKVQDIVQEKYSKREGISQDHSDGAHSISSYHGYRIKNKDNRPPHPQEAIDPNTVYDGSPFPRKKSRFWPPSPLAEVKKMEKPETTTAEQKMEKPETTTAEHEVEVDDDRWTTNFTLLGLNVAEYTQHYGVVKSGELKKYKYEEGERFYFVQWEDGEINNSWRMSDVLDGTKLYEEYLGSQKSCVFYNAPREWCTDNNIIGLPIIGLRVADFFPEAEEIYGRLHIDGVYVRKDFVTPFFGEVTKYSKAYEELDVPTAQGWPNDLYVIEWYDYHAEQASKNRQLSNHLDGRYPTFPGSTAYTNDEFQVIFYKYQNYVHHNPVVVNPGDDDRLQWTTNHMTIGTKLAKILPDLSLEYTFGWKVHVGKVAYYAENAFYQYYRIQWQDDVADELSRASIMYQRESSRRPWEEKHSHGAEDYYNNDEVIAGQKLLEVWNKCGSRFPKIQFESTHLNDRPNRGVDYHSIVDTFHKKLKEDIPAVELSPFNCMPPGKYIDMGLPSAEYREFLGAGKCHVIGFRDQFDSKLRGIFALQSISSDAFLGRLHGEVLNFGEFNKRRKEPGPSFVTKFAPNLEVYLCSRDYGNVLKFMNHHCTKANCVIRSFVDFDGSLALGMWTVRDIQAGDDLFCNYGFRLPSKNWRTNCMNYGMYQSPCMCVTDCSLFEGRHFSFEKPIKVSGFPYMKST